jgi:hypothetical protein
MEDQIKFSIVTTVQIASICLLTTLFYIVIEIIFGDKCAYYFAINPFTSGLLHSNFNHLFWNIFGIFVSLNMRCNRFYTYERIFWITSLIALLYLPIILIDSGFASIGISGTCYFLLARGLLSLKRLKLVGYFIISSIIIAEFAGLGGNDEIAHTVHIIGAILGILSLPKFRLNFIHEKIYEIIG